MKIPFVLVLPVLALPSLLLPGSVVAQAEPDSAAARDTAAIPVDPIRVTVLRTPLRLSETPYSVTVELAEGRGPGLSLLESLGSVPGLQVDNRYNAALGDRLSVRGLGARAQFGVRGVKVLVDGIPATMPDGQTSLSHVDPRAVGRAEVVRGPASSLWGNAAGGVIQLETAPPPGSGADGSVTALTGSHGLTHYGGDGGWSAPGGGDDGFGLRASASRLLYRGFRDHAASDKRFGAVRAEWRRGRDALAVVAHGVAYSAENPGSLSSELLAEDRTQAYGFNVAQGTGESAEQAQVGLTWRRALGSGDPGPGTGGAGTGGGPTLEVTAWGLTRNLDNPIPPVIIDLSRRAAGVRGSLRGGLELAGRSLRWVAGVDAEGQWDDRLNFENDGGERGALALDQAERVTAVAPFLELSAPVAGPLSALAGLRYDRHRFAADDRLMTAGDPATDASGERVMGQLSPSLGLTAALPGASVYAGVASSFETPTTTELVNRPTGDAGFNPELEPQRTRALEAGLRTGLGERVRVHAAAYRLRVRDALIPFEVATSPGRTFFRNAGSAVHQGVELDAWLVAAPGLRLRLGWAWVDARFEDFVTEDGDRSGNRVPGVAPHRVTGRAVWTPAGGRLELAGRWVDAVPVDDANTATAPAYTALDLRAASPSLSVAGAAVELFGGVSNALDTDYVAAVTVNAFGGRYYEPGPGRAVYWGVRVGADRGR